MLGQSRGDPAWLSRAGVGSGPWGPRRAAPNTHADSGGPAPRGRAAVPGQRPGRSRYSFVPGSVAMRSCVGLTSRGRVQLGRAHGRGGSSGDSSFILGAALRWGSGGFWEGASAPSPLPWDSFALSPFNPPTRLRGAAVGAHRGSNVSGHGRRPLKASGCRGCGRGHSLRQGRLTHFVSAWACGPDGWQGLSGPAATSPGERTTTLKRSGRVEGRPGGKKCRAPVANRFCEKTFPQTGNLARARVRGASSPGPPRDANFFRRWKPNRRKVKNHKPE